jgi:hypothetical protein
MYNTVYLSQKREIDLCFFSEFNFNFSVVTLNQKVSVLLLVKVNRK